MEDLDDSSLKRNSNEHKSLDEDFIEMQESFRIPESSAWYKFVQAYKWYSFWVIAIVVAVVAIYQILT